MREIKFRAYNKKNKRMLDSESLRYIGGLALISGHSTDEFLVLPTAKENIILLQYTGLKDKNGVEIYEGDIVKATNNIYEIRFVNAGFVGLLNGRHDYDIISHMLCTYELEVIGNIHENPELLDQS